MSYDGESHVLETRILEVIRTWHAWGRGLSDDEFDELALQIFPYQLRYNKPYAQFCAARGVTESSLPQSWEEIPAVPAAAYKEVSLTTFDYRKAALMFETSGTTQGVAGKHYMETPALYDAALLATFDRLVLKSGLPENSKPLRYLNLLRDPERGERASSLGYMMRKIVPKFGDGKDDWYIIQDKLRLEDFITDVKQAISEPYPLFITGTAFSFVEACDTLTEQGRKFVLPEGSLVMETGGFKGQSRVVKREDLYAGIADRFGIAEDRIFSEYGMTELTSQYYDATFTDQRIKTGPPWLRARIVGVDGKSVPKGVVGTLAHVDLANRSSCIAIQTEDLGAEIDGGFVLLGREQGAALRGCSLDAESVRAR